MATGTTGEGEEHGLLSDGVNRSKTILSAWHEISTQPYEDSGGGWHDIMNETRVESAHSKPNCAVGMGILHEDMGDSECDFRKHKPDKNSCSMQMQAK